MPSLLTLVLYLSTGCIHETLRNAGPSMDPYPLVDEAAEREEEDWEIEDRLDWMLAATGTDNVEEFEAVRLDAWRSIEDIRVAQGLEHLPASWCDPDDTDREGCDGPGDGNDPGDPGTGAPGDESPASCAWTSAGPTNIAGRVQSLAIDPLDHDRVYAASVGGLWRSADGGRRWERVTDDMQAGIWSAIAARGTRVVAARGDDNSIHAWGAGIFTSDSRGETGSWVDTGAPAPLSASVVHRLRLDPTGKVAWAATSSGLWTADLTASPVAWTRVGGMDADTDDLAIDWSASPPVAWVAVRAASGTYGVGVWRWDGNDWVDRSDGLPTGDVRRIALALAASAPDTLYTRIVNALGRQVGIYKTTTAGVASGGTPGWSALTGADVVDDAVWPGKASGYSWWVNVIEVDPSDANRVYAGGLRIFRTINGNDFANVSGGAEAGWTFDVHADQHAIAFDPDDPSIVWLGNDGGVARTSDTANAIWRWENRAHGMVDTEFHRVTGQSSVAGLRAGGSQDNGTELTFGNRTWYAPHGCDGATVAFDAGSSVTLYANCNGSLFEFANPIPDWMGGPSYVAWSSDRPPRQPLVTDPNLPGRALAATDAVTDDTGTITDPPQLLVTTDGKTWTQANASQPLAKDQQIRVIAIAPSSGFETWYLGLKGAPHPAIWHTEDGGASWDTNWTGITSGTINDIEVDAADPHHAYLALGDAGADSGVWRTTDGENWTRLAGTGATAWPGNVDALSLAIDPADPNTVYVTTPGGVLRATHADSDTDVAWSPYDDGLPLGLTGGELWMNPATGVLTLGTMGYATWRRDTSADASCRERMLLVRDHVHDQGLGPAPNGEPDPEHPVPDPDRPGFFKPDDSAAGRLYWWESTDIRVDVPATATTPNLLPTVDHVEFETCPIEMGTCPAGTLHDVSPVRGEQARVFAQVANPGIAPTRDVRVIALYADASSGLPDLPDDFWTTTFPEGAAACGPLSAGSGWHLVDPANPCRTVPVVNPMVPEVASFTWDVPADQASHTCMLVVTDSADDPIPASVRGANERRVWRLVPGNRQVANRNLHVVDLPASGGGSGATPGGAGWPESLPTQPALTISTAGLPEGTKLGLLLPSGVRPRGLAADAVQLGDDALATAKELGLDTSVAWYLDQDEVTVEGLFTGPGQQVPFMLVWSGFTAPAGSTWRITSVERAGEEVIGGEVWLLRVH